MNLFFDGPVGDLEAIYETAPHPSGWAALVCHPHPVYGGTMRNRVVVRIARALLAAGANVLRFNFRGVERSRGAYDGGVGEQADAAAALEFLKSRNPGAPLCVGGFSFGSWVGFKAGLSDAAVCGFLGVGVPINRFDFDFLAGSAAPKWIIQGGEDEFGDVAELERAMSRWTAPTELTVIPDADHFFSDHIADLERRALVGAQWIRSHLNYR
jgi:hypothetical protein